MGLCFSWLTQSILQLDRRALEQSLENTEMFSKIASGGKYQLTAE
jgi:hypothetical protein